MQRGVLTLWKQPPDNQVQTSLPWWPGKPLLMEARFFKSKARLHTPFSTPTFPHQHAHRPSTRSLLFDKSCGNRTIGDSECRIHGALCENQRLGVFATHCHHVRRWPETSTTRPYPLERGDVQAYNIAQGQSSFQKNGVFLGKVPRHVVVGLVRNDAYVGDKDRNPFNFQLFHLKSVKLLVNGEEYPAPGIELEDNGHVNGYNSLFLGSGTMHRGEMVFKWNAENGAMVTPCSRGI